MASRAKKRDLRTELRKRFSDYESRYAAEEGRPVPQLPKAGLPKRAAHVLDGKRLRALSVRQKIAALRFFAECRALGDNGQPARASSITDALRLSSYGGLKDEQSLRNFARKILAWSDDELANRLRRKPAPRRREKSVYHQLVGALEAGAGPSSTLPTELQWTRWLDEEIRFWITEGWLPPRICYILNGRRPPAPSGLQLDKASAANWREFLREWSETEAIQSRKFADKYKAQRKAEFLRDCGEDLHEWVKAVCRLAEQILPRLGRGHVADFESASRKTVVNALQGHGYRWQTDSGRARGFGQWVVGEDSPPKKRKLFRKGQ
jgi:hypothetical protein